MYFEVPKVNSKVLNKGLPQAILATPRFVDSGELIFVDEHILKL
jgi:hypothetical protein